MKHLRAIKKEHGDLHMIYSVDDKGNEYNNVIFTPNVGNWDTLNEFITEQEGGTPINTVCIN